jgi:uroporphyrinogen-III synthase
LPDSFRRGVLVTRPEPGARDTAERLRALGFVPVMAQALCIRPVAAELGNLGEIQAVVVPSGNALPALPAGLRDRMVLAVGDATARRARDDGFHDVRSANGDADALTALAVQACSPANGPLLLVCGRGQSNRLAAALRGAGFTVRRRVTYAATPVLTLPPDARRALATDSVSAALFFSGETAAAFVKLALRAKIDVSGIDAISIGQPAAVALKALPWRSIRRASQPTQDAMLALLS